jgi:undecaprenyl-diphosphatase
LRSIDAFDRRLFDWLTRTERRWADRQLLTLSTAANRSMLWLGVAALLALADGDRGKRAARRGVTAIAITSTLVNLPLKYFARRDRPAARRRDRPLPLAMPGSFSFPSGHAASAFAFATAVAQEEPRALPAILPLASAVAYSRVHLRVHYPLDVLAGAAIGAAMGFASGAVLEAGRSWWVGLGPVADELRPQTKRLVLVTSPNAGKEQKLTRARRAMATYGLTVQAEIGVSELSQLSSLLSRNGEPPPIVVAAGGDGTVGAVANALVGSNAVLGVLPLGTSNDFARSIGVPLSPESAVRLLARGPIHRVDAGRLTGDGAGPRHFVHAAATGLNVAFARFATRADLRERLGRLTYAVAAALALRERPVFDCHIDFGDHREDLSLVHLSVINAPVFGGFLDLRIPDVAADDRTLHVLMIEHLPLRRLIRSALYPAIGVHRRIRGFRIVPASQVTVRPVRPMDVTLDGEVRGRLPGTFEVVPSALRVLAPMAGGNHLR